MATNDQIIFILREEIIPGLRNAQEGLVQINHRLAVLNGSVAQNVRRIGENVTAIAEIKEDRIQSAKLFTELQTILAERERLYSEREAHQQKEINEGKAAGRERNARQQKEIDEGKTDRKAMLEKIWAIGSKVAELGVLLAALTKIMDVW